MRRLPQLCGALTAAVIGLSTLALPAVAHTGPIALSCAGTAEVSPGLTVLGDKNFIWQISTRCDADGDPSTLEATLSATGTGFGRCGSTTAASGVGEVEFDDGHRIELSNIAWPILPVVSGNHDNGVGDGNQDGTFSALVHMSGESDCLAEGATWFDVTIEALLD